jgi:hypothetical protein
LIGTTSPSPKNCCGNWAGRPAASARSRWSSGTECHFLTGQNGCRFRGSRRKCDSSPAMYGRRRNDTSMRLPEHHRPWRCRCAWLMALEGQLGCGWTMRRIRSGFATR